MSPKYYKNLPQSIYFIDIGLNGNQDLVRWRGSGSNVFLLDIISARKKAKSEFFLHLEKPNHRMVFTKKKEIVFIISSKDNVQYQLLESILEKVMDDFFKAYEDLIDDPVLLSGMASTFDGFRSTIIDSFEDTLKQKVKWLEPFCAICKEKIPICVRKSLISEADHYPVSLVFEHEGHGLLLYIDRQFHLRGHEIVEISG